MSGSHIYSVDFLRKLAQSPLVSNPEWVYDLTEERLGGPLACRQTLERNPPPGPRRSQRGNGAYIRRQDRRHKPKGASEDWLDPSAGGMPIAQGDKIAEFEKWKSAQAPGRPEENDISNEDNYTNSQSNESNSRLATDTVSRGSRELWEAPVSIKQTAKGSRFSNLFRDSAADTSPSKSHAALGNNGPNGPMGPTMNAPMGSSMNSTIGSNASSSIGGMPHGMPPGIPPSMASNMGPLSVNSMNSVNALGMNAHQSASTSSLASSTMSPRQSVAGIPASVSANSKNPMSAAAGAPPNFPQQAINDPNLGVQGQGQGQGQVPNGQGQVPNGQGQIPIQPPPNGQLPIQDQPPNGQFSQTQIPQQFPEASQQIPGQGQPMPMSYPMYPPGLYPPGMMPPGMGPPGMAPPGMNMPQMPQMPQVPIYPPGMQPVAPPGMNRDDQFFRQLMERK